MSASRFPTQGFELEVTRAMVIAFSDSCKLLKLTGRVNLSTDIVAMKIMELAQQGETDPVRLCQGAMKHFRAKSQH